MVEIQDILSLTKGVGGSYTKWQRSPPPHIVYQVKLSNKKTVILQVHAENTVLDDPDYPTIQRISDTNHLKRDGHLYWSDLSDEEQDVVREALEEEVKEEPFFQD